MSDVRPAMGPVERLWIARLPVSLRSVFLAEYGSIDAAYRVYTGWKPVLRKALP